MMFFYIGFVGLSFVRLSFPGQPARSGSVQQVIAEIARSVGAPLSWIPPADLGPVGPSDGARPLAQFLQVKGFSHTLQVGPGVPHFLMGSGCDET